MHDFLYENQRFMGDDSYFAKAETKMKLDAARITREVAKNAYSSRIEEDYMSGIRSGVNGTPTFFINGVRYDGYPGVEPIVAALRDAAKGSRRKK